MSTTVSPLAPTSVPELPVIDGVKLATAAAGIRYQGRTDVLLALFDKGTTVAGVFTKSKCPSAAVDWCRAKLKKGQARALVVTVPDAFESGEVVRVARLANPQLQIIARADSDACMAHLQQQGADLVVLAEPELARGMLEHLRAGEAAPRVA